MKSQLFFAMRDARASASVASASEARAKNPEERLFSHPRGAKAGLRPAEGRPLSRGQQRPAEGRPKAGPRAASHPFFRIHGALRPAEGRPLRVVICESYATKNVLFLK